MELNVTVVGCLTPMKGEVQERAVDVICVNC